MTFQVKNIQRGLVARGHELGDTGLKHDGIDGDLGPRTLAAIHDEIGLPPGAGTIPGFALGARDGKRLRGVHSDLVRIVRRAAALTPVRFAVLEGIRTQSRQRELVARGASKTMNSRHLTGHAVDIAPLDAAGTISWDWPLYYRLAPAVKQAAADLGIPVEWGGDWRHFKDGPHWQLPLAKYPTGR